MNSTFTINQFRQRFPDEKACLDELMLHKYGANPTCPNTNCAKQTKFHPVKGRKCYECQWCGYQVYPMVGTVLQGTSTALTDWFYVMYLMTATRSGISAKEVQRQLGVTYKCAWRMCRQIRAAMNEKPVLKDKVELDETYVGGKRRGTRGRGAEGKSVVFGAVERKGSVNGYVVPDAKAKTLMPIILKTVDGSAKVYTDEFRSYGRLTSNNFTHETVQHGLRQFAKGEAHTNNLEGFWSRLKTSIVGTYVWVSEQHLQKYVDEFAFRYNQRATSVPMFERLLRNLARPS